MRAVLKAMGGDVEATVEWLRREANEENMWAAGVYVQHGWLRYVDDETTGGTVYFFGSARVGNGKWRQTMVEMSGRIVIYSLDPSGLKTRDFVGGGFWGGFWGWSGGGVIGKRWTGKSFGALKQKFSPTRQRNNYYSAIRAAAWKTFTGREKVLRDVREFEWMKEEQKREFPNKVKGEVEKLEKAMKEGHFTWNCVGQKGVMLRKLLKATEQGWEGPDNVHGTFLGKGATLIENKKRKGVVAV